MQSSNLEFLFNLFTNMGVYLIQSICLAYVFIPPPLRGQDIFLNPIRSQPKHILPHRLKDNQNDTLSSVNLLS